MGLYIKNNDGSYISCSDNVFVEDCVEVEDDLLAEGYNHSLYLKTFLENPDEEYLDRKKKWEDALKVSEYKKYLSDTDYIVAKLSELKIEDEDEYNTEKERYSDILTKRKEARMKINEMEIDDNEKA